MIRLVASLRHGGNGRHAVSLRLDLAEEFPPLTAETPPERLLALQRAGSARCAAVLRADFKVLSVYFGGKKLR